MPEEPLIPTDSPSLTLPHSSSLNVGKVDAEVAAAMFAAQAHLARYGALRAAIGQRLSSLDQRAQLPIVEAELRGTVAHLVLLLRARTVTPERMLISLKGLLTDAAPPERDVADAVSEQVIGWAIEDFFRAS